MDNMEGVFDAIVIGCGAAGLTAVARLSQAGKKVLGLEGNSRIGGRIHTIQFGNGTVELGAEWIHGEKDNNSFELAKAANIPIEKQSIDFLTHTSDGSVSYSNVCDELIGYCYRVIDTAPDSSEPLGSYVNRKFYEFIKNRPEILDNREFCEEFMLLLELLVCNYDATNSWHDITLNGLNVYHHLDGHQHWSWQEFGYKTLFDLILNQTSNPVDILLNKEVTNIEWNNDDHQVTVNCSDGTKYITKSVILTVSLGVLQERHATLFSPPLPPKKVKAINSLCIGVVDKICLRYDDVWWPKTKTFHSFLWRKADKENVPQRDNWTTKIFGFSSPSGSDNVITLWTSGEAAKIVEVLPEEEVMEKCRELLEKFMGTSVPDAAELRRSQWYSDRFFRGSYSYRGRAWDKKPEVFEEFVEPLYGKSLQPEILFAGEATSKHCFSTVHGAIQTGIRESDRLINCDVLNNASSCPASSSKE